MLNEITLSHVFVLDQDEALDFYVDKLGLEVANDIEMGYMRWLTVRVPGQMSREVLLEKLGPPAMDDETAEQAGELLTKGATGVCIGFTTSDCKATYETLLERGVEITQEPTERFYGIDLGVRDPFGNAIRILEPHDVTQEPPGRSPTP